MRKALVALLLSLLFVSPAYAATSVTKYVDTDGANGDGSSGTPYSSLANALSDIDSDYAGSIVDDDVTITIKCAGTAADTTQATVSTTTDDTRRIDITCDDGKADGCGPGYWSTSHYRLDLTTAGAYYAALEFATTAASVDRIQIRHQGSGGRDQAIRLNAATTSARITRNVIVTQGSGSEARGIDTLWVNDNPKASIDLTVANNIVYIENGAAAGISCHVWGITGTPRRCVIYNNTVKGAGRCIDINAGSSTDYAYVRNNLMDCTDTDYTTTGTWTTLTTGKNLTADSSSPDGGTYQSKTAVYVSSPSDLHITSGATNAIDLADDLSGDAEYAFSTDIDTQTKTTWDIGADEYASSTTTTTTVTTTTTTVTTTSVTTTTLSGMIATELCGDGVDNDGTGGDSACSEPDKDNDGYESASGTGTDCDDTNRYIYPGISTTSGCAAGSYRTCQVGGSYTSCVASSVTPLCEKTGSGHCYYFDFVSGSNSNACTYASPCKDYLKFNSFTDPSDSERPASPITPVPGDVFYFLDGTYTTTFSDTAAGLQALFLSVPGTATDKITIKAYPGHSPIFRPALVSTGAWSYHSAINLYGADYVVVEGIEIDGAAGEMTDGLVVEGGTGAEVRNMTIHDVDGVRDNNPAGIHLIGTYQASLHHNRLYDNYDRESAANDNITNIVTFSGVGDSITRNVAYYTSSSNSGICIKNKHGTTGPLYVDHNVVWNCGGVGIGIATRNASVKHNRIWKSGRGVGIEDWGGTDYLEYTEVEYNTIYDSIPAITTDYVDTDGGIGPHTISHNVIVGDKSSFPNDYSILGFATYNGDVTYTSFEAAGSTIDENCYHNINAAGNSVIRWCLFCANGGAYGSLGELMKFSVWQSVGYDAASFVEDPLLDSYQRATSGNCSDMGWSAGSYTPPLPPAGQTFKFSAFNRRLYAK